MASGHDGGVAAETAVARAPAKVQQDGDGSRSHAVAAGPGGDGAVETGAAEALKTLALTAEPDPRQAGLEFRPYTSEHLLPAIAELIAKDLSEPYSVYTYRYFVNEWPQLCKTGASALGWGPVHAGGQVHDGQALVGVVIGRVDLHHDRLRGYIAMLAVEVSHRKRGIVDARRLVRSAGSTLVRLVVQAMEQIGCQEVVLEAEVTNRGALSLYENLGFLRDKRLHRYYMNGSDAYRLKLWLS